MQDGRQFILTPQPTLNGLGGWAAMAHVAPAGNRAVAFVFRLETAEDSFALHLPGLDAQATYRVRVADQDAPSMTGAQLAAGLRVHVEAPYRSRTVSVEQIA